MSKPSFREIEALIKKFKCVDRELSWNTKDSNMNYLFCAAQVVDNENKTIEGCLFEGLFKQNGVLTSEKYAFTVYLLRGSVKYRIFQLEVDDWNKITHRDKVNGNHTKGPHLHIGASEHWPESRIINFGSEYKKFSFANWLLEYCKRGNLKLAHSLEHPASQGSLDLSF